MALSLSGTFGTVKPVIAMVHFPGLPGRPQHDRAAGRAHLLDVIARDPDRVAGLVAGAQESTQPAAAFAAQMAALNNHDCTSRIGGVTVPTLVIAASDDIIIRPQLSRRLFELIPENNRRWTVVPGGHAAFWEDPEPWNRAVIEFVRANSAA